MNKFIKTNISSLIINFIFLIFLLFGIQNSNESKSINFLSYKSVKLPISFIIGTSFIKGSIAGTLIFSILKIKNNNQNQSYRQ